MAAGPRVLVTGFEPFPGAPVNPTEWLVGSLKDDPPAGLLEHVEAFRAEVLPVDYAAVGPRLSELGRECAPDIAIHFGLADECSGFRLERLARNRFAADRPDNSGAMRDAGQVCAGPETLESGLPLQAIHDRLAEMKLPVEWSDDAGGYLCNTVFMLSRAKACAGFAPAMSGFVHVPLTGDGPDHALTPDDLRTGALAILDLSCREWRRRHSI